MATLLHLDSSGQNESSVTRKLSAYYAQRWLEANPGSRVIYRDLTTSSIDFVSNQHINAFFTPNDSLDAEQKDLIRLPDELARELQDADTYVIGAPMYNFSIPAVLKAYIDMIVRAGVTFSYSSTGLEGLLKNKKVIVVTASGSDFSRPAMKGYDFLEPYLRAIFGFIGITDVTFIKSHGTKPDVIAENSKVAQAEIDRSFSLAVSVA